MNCEVITKWAQYIWSNPINYILTLYKQLSGFFPYICSKYLLNRQTYLSTVCTLKLHNCHRIVCSVDIFIFCLYSFISLTLYFCVYIIHIKCYFNRVCSKFVDKLFRTYVFKMKKIRKKKVKYSNVAIMILLND